ncbi:unnamed protein product, partial [Sphacelaria rigidula]
MKDEAVRILRGEAGFGIPLHAVRCSEIALSGFNSGEKASEEGLVKGYGLPFNIKPPANARIRQPRPFIRKCAGLFEKTPLFF